MKDLSRIVKPHNLKSREVTKADLKKVLEEAMIMHDLLQGEIGCWSGGVALAHCQVDDKDPMMFFVTKEGDIYINPSIISHSAMPKLKLEGCLTFHQEGTKEKTIARYPAIIVRFRTLDTEGDLTDYEEKKFNNIDAQMFQHEINHFDSKYIYEY